MRIEEIIWLDAIVDKLAVKHGVEIEEVEEVPANKPQFRYVEKGKRTGENVYMASGQTNGGRYLLVLFIHKATHDALILSARDMSNRERKSLNENKMPEFESVEELVEYFDNNDMAECWDEMPPVHFDVDIQRRSFLVSIDKELMKKLAEVAKAQHTSTEQLVHAWLEEKAAQAA